MKLKCLVTGSAGYIGRILHRRLRELGHEVVGVDRKQSGYTDANGKDEFVQVIMDLAEADVPTPAPGKKPTQYDAVFHLAASSLLGPSVGNPEDYYLNNVGSTAKLLKGLHSIGFKGAFVFASSAAVYGDQGDKPCDSEHTVLNPINPYGATKVACEELIEFATRRDEFTAVALRFFNVAGSHGDLTQDTDQPHVLTAMARAAFNDEPFTINGIGLGTQDGTCQRSYVHVLDLANAMITVATKILVKDTWYDKNGGVRRFSAVNVGSSRTCGVIELLSIFNKEIDVAVKVQFGPSRPGDPVILKPAGGFIPIQTIYGGMPFNNSSIDSIVRSHTAGIFEKLTEQADADVEGGKDNDECSSSGTPGLF